MDSENLIDEDKEKVRVEKKLKPEKLADAVVEYVKTKPEEPEPNYFGIQAAILFGLAVLPPVLGFMVVAVMVGLHFMDWVEDGQIYEYEEVDE